MSVAPDAHPALFCGSAKVALGVVDDTGKDVVSSVQNGTSGWRIWSSETPAGGEGGWTGVVEVRWTRLKSEGGGGVLEGCQSPLIPGLVEEV